MLQRPEPVILTQLWRSGPHNTRVDHHHNEQGGWTTVHHIGLNHVWKLSGLQGCPVCTMMNLKIIEFLSEIPIVIDASITATRYCGHCTYCENTYTYLEYQERHVYNNHKILAHFKSPQLLTKNIYVIPCISTYAHLRCN